MYCLPSYLKGGTAQSELSNQVAPKFGKETAIMLITVFGSLFIGMILVAMGDFEDGVASILAGLVIMLAGVFIPVIVYFVSA